MTTDNQIKDGEFHRLFLCLKGEWDLFRDYSDGSSFNGSAVFTEIEQDVFHLIEKGSLRLNTTNGPLSAQREWIWQLRPYDQILISYPPFEIGKPYHLLTFIKQNTNWAANAKHLCAPDKYLGNYMLSENQIVIKHEVSGPKKDYQFKANYTRS